MPTKYLKCTFETGVVLLTTSNTEGRREVLDFIPGSKFVGVAAKLINQGKLAKLDFDALHDGSIRFGEATLLKGRQTTYKVPLSYYRPKIQDPKNPDTSKIYHHHLTTKEDHETYQLQQIRSGYILQNKDVYYEPSYSYRQKSTRPKGEKKNMYGYDAADRSQEWIFAIHAQDEEVLSEVVEAFVKESHAIGTSKRVEYGKVRFEEVEPPAPITKLTNSNAVLLYVKSRLSLFDPSSGQPLLEPTIESLGLSSGKIDWKNTQIRTTTYSPVNGAQGGSISERIIIEQGSIIALNGVEESELKIFDEPIGSFTNEGYGEIVLNPSFLERAYSNFEVADETKEIVIRPLEEFSGNDEFLKALVAKKREENERAELIKVVDDFISDHENEALFTNMNAQWGKIRALVLSSREENVLERIKRYMENGIEKAQWEGKKEKIFNHIKEKQITDVSGFLQQVAQQMQLLSKKSTQRGVKDAV